MGYESKIYFVKEYDFPYEGLHHSEIVAMLDMGKMGYSDTVERFKCCFDTKTEFSLYVSGCDDEGNEVMLDKTEDEYGARLKYASDVAKLHECAKQMAKESNYWRFKVLRDMIASFTKNPDIKIVHYGY